MSKNLGSVRQEIGEIKGLVLAMKDSNDRNFKALWDQHNDKIAPAVSQFPALQERVKNLEKGQEKHKERHDYALSRWVGIVGGIMGSAGGAYAIFKGWHG